MEMHGLLGVEYGWPMFQLNPRLEGRGPLSLHARNHIGMSQNCLKIVQHVEPQETHQVLSFPIEISPLDQFPLRLQRMLRKAPSHLS